MENLQLLETIQPYSLPDQKLIETFEIPVGLLSTEIETLGNRSLAKFKMQIKTSFPYSYQTFFYSMTQEVSLHLFLIRRKYFVSEENNSL